MGVEPGGSAGIGQFTMGEEGAPAIHMHVDGLDGRLGINMDGLFPSVALDVAGDGQFAGTVCANNISCPSDARMKENITPFDNALETVAQLRGVRYDWTADAITERKLPDNRQIGLVAQEVSSVVPEAVHTMADGHYALDYGRLVPVLIEAIKEQQAQIESLEERLRELER
jgi:hypothetical protein